ncbi:GntR family transcriptional regulator [bacterium]|nr:GntR family transcriptional regulator [candidate division CSSED10-310 bacterium]
MKSLAYDEIKRRILTTEIAPGARIREDLIAEELQISRTPVREAVNQLIIDGFIISLPRRGVYCIELTEDDINNILDVRCSLEVLAVRDCVRHMTEKNFQKMVEVNSLFKRSVDIGDIDEISKNDNEFHRLLADFSQNMMLIKLLGQVRDFVKLIWATESIRTKPQINEVSGEEHDELLECIRSKDIARGQAIIYNHVGLLTVKPSEYTLLSS